MNSDAQWWNSFHVIEMADLFLERDDPKELDTTVNFLMRELQLSSGAHVFDQCCGIGSLGIEMAKREVNAIGVDLCQAYIDRANEFVQKNEIQNCQFKCADAFEFSTQHPCDGVFNWYSSFGYASTNNQNKEMLRRAYDSLKPGGYYALDIPNFTGVLRGFQKQLIRKGASDGREVTCIRDCKINMRDGLLEQTWNWHVEGRPVDQRNSALRIYLAHEIIEMLEETGFDSIELFGGIDKCELHLDSPRLIILARKSK